MKDSENRSPADRTTDSPAVGVGLQPLRFGNLDLKTNLFLSPLAGYTTCHSA